MRLNDLFSEIYWALLGNKARSALTILGIVIGIGSVIAMVAIGQGAQGAIQSSIESIGSNLIIISPGVQRGVGTQVSSGQGSAQTLKQADADAIQKEIANIKAIAPDLSRRYQITAKGTNSNVQVTGTTPSYTDVRNIQITQGSFISDSQVQGNAKVAVLGPQTRDDLFGEGVDAIGQSIKINKIEFRVIGITVAKGGSGFLNPDNVIYIPITTAQRFLAGNENISTISVQAQDQSSMATVQQEITNLLLERHQISDPTQADFNVFNQSDIVAAASSVTGTFTILLASIAGISLLVGGIGIMNMMLTTVTERTREIGLRKAIGAYRTDISRQFLMEAITLTFLGGAAGVILGWLICLGVTNFAGITTSVTLSSIGLAFGVSAGIGIIFGYYPARRAAGLNPIEALRYE